MRQVQVSLVQPAEPPPVPQVLVSQVSVQAQPVWISFVSPPPIARDRSQVQRAEGLAVEMQLLSSHRRSFQPWLPSRRRLRASLSILL